jgi:hypothetical protein
MASDPAEVAAQAGPAPPKEDVHVGLVDLTGLTLSHLSRLGRSSLDLALMRALAPQDDSSDPVLGFQSAI